jgi:hypothetical protein
MFPALHISRRHKGVHGTTERTIPEARDHAGTHGGQRDVARQDCVRLAERHGERGGGVDARQRGLDHRAGDRGGLAPLVLGVLVQEEQRPDKRVRPEVEQSAAAENRVEDPVCLRDVCSPFNCRSVHAGNHIHSEYQSPRCSCD